MDGFDYSQSGAYYVTLVTRDREPIFGWIENGEMNLNPCGEIARAVWEDLPQHYPGMDFDAYCIMPNHMHGIIIIRDDVGEGLKPSPTMPLSEIIRGFKTFSARKINEFQNTPGRSIWQRNFFDRIIRSNEELEKIRDYIFNNPAHWNEDIENNIHR